MVLILFLPGLPIVNLGRTVVKAMTDLGSQPFDHDNEWVDVLRKG